MINKNLNIVIAIFLEVIAWYLLESATAEGELLLQFLLLHAIASYFFARSLMQYLPANYLANNGRLILFFFSICFFIPYLGVLGLYIAWNGGLYWPRANTFNLYNITEEPPLPFKPLVISESSHYGQAGLPGIVKNAADSNKRLKAIMATRQLDDRDAIPILKIALKDPIDEVRLLAYSMLDAKEQAINSGIQKLEKELVSSPLNVRASLHKELAHYYWELAYLGLAQGDVKQLVLNQSCKNLFIALKINSEDAGTCFELGRVLLRLDRHEEARHYLALAMKLGISESDVLPYLAEVAFHISDYPQVKLLLAKLPESARKNTSLNNMINFWLHA